MNSVKPVYKSVNDKFPVELDYSAPDLDEAETITGVEIPSPPAGLTLGSPQIKSDGKGVFVEISDGVPGELHLIVFRVTTSGGKIYHNRNRDRIPVKVEW